MPRLRLLRLWQHLGLLSLSLDMDLWLMVLALAQPLQRPGHEAFLFGLVCLIFRLPHNLLCGSDQYCCCLWLVDALRLVLLVSVFSGCRAPSTCPAAIAGTAAGGTGLLQVPSYSRRLPRVSQEAWLGGGPARRVAKDRSGEGQENQG